MMRVRVRVQVQVCKEGRLFSWLVGWLVDTTSCWMKAGLDFLKTSLVNMMHGCDITGAKPVAVPR